jgi:hypothetical protein
VHKWLLLLCKLGHLHMVLLLLRQLLLLCPLMHLHMVLLLLLLLLLSPADAWLLKRRRNRLRNGAGCRCST